MMETIQRTGEMGVVCQPPKNGVTTLCLHCGVRPARKKFCCGACRQTAYRKSRAHRAQLDKQKARRAIRKEFDAAKNRDKHFTFDGSHSGSSVDWVGRLADRLLPGEKPKQPSN